MFIFVQLLSKSDCHYRTEMNVWKCLGYVATSRSVQTLQVFCIIFQSSQTSLHVSL